MKKIILLILLFGFFFPVFSFKIHPYHVGSVEFVFNNKSKTFEITGKFFTDDLENAINKKYGSSLFFSNPKDHAKFNEYLKKYSEEYLKLKADHQFVKINYLGFEEDQEAVRIYLESEPVKIPKKVETSVSMLYNLFDDQMNIVHVIVGGQRQSHNLTYPERYFYKIF